MQPRTHFPLNIIISSFHYITAVIALGKALCTRNAAANEK
jgi:hypothetical protein